MENFENLWDSKVKHLAYACIDSDVMKLFGRMEKAENENEKEKIREDAKAVVGKYKDSLAMYKISSMCWMVEHDLADGREWKARFPVFSIYNVLCSESYWNDVFKGDLRAKRQKGYLH